ncbi:MAG TPA: hypothetical protein VGL07_16700 [Buttiauxella sp.]|jgi:hypothetical protein
MDMKFSIQQRIPVVDVVDRFTTHISDETIAELYDDRGRHMMLESVTLEEIVATYFVDTQLCESESMMLEAITTSRVRLVNTMKAFNRALNAQLSASGITAGVSDKGEAAEDATVIGGAEVGRVRKTSGFAIIPARIPLSDGQSITVIFHSPSNDPEKIKANDVLVAFRFMLNKRDITHVVAPARGKDISLKQVCLALANLVERNSERFKASKDKNAKLLVEINDLSDEAEKLTTQQRELIEEGDELQNKAALLNSDATNYRELADKQAATNDDLRAQIEARKKALRSNIVLDGPENSPNTPQQSDPAEKDISSAIPEPASEKMANNMPSESLKSYYYGLKARPVSPGAVPDGWTAVIQPQEVSKQVPSLNGITDSDLFRHGVIVYPAPLSKDEISNFELVDFANVETPSSRAAKLELLRELMKQAYETDTAQDAGAFFTTYIKPAGAMVDLNPFVDANGKYAPKEFQKAMAEAGYSSASDVSDIWNQVIRGNEHANKPVGKEVEPTEPEVDEQAQQKNAAVVAAAAILNDIIKVKEASSAELKEIIGKMRSALVTIQEAGEASTYDDLMSQASAHITELMQGTMKRQEAA